MTVSSTSNKVVYQGNGATTAFAFGFAFPGNITLAQAAADLIVTFVPASGPSQVIAYGFGSTNYQLSLNAPVSPNPTGAGGTVIYNPLGVPIPLGSSLVIQRALPATQGVSLQNQGTLWQQVIEQALDYLTMLEQQVAATIGQAILVPATDPVGLNYTVPAVAARANQFLAFDANGNVVTAPGTGSLVIPPGNQTITGAWTFTSPSGVTVSASPTAQFQSFGGNSRNVYSGSIASGTGVTAVLSSNPVNYLTGVACCSADSTLVSSCLLVTGGGKTQVAQIGQYNAATKTVTITGNVYDNAGNLIGANFNPVPAAGFTFVVDRLDYGAFRTIVDRNLTRLDFWNLGSTPQLQQFQPTGASPFAQTLSPITFNRLAAVIQLQYPLTGGGNVPLYISPNSPNNSDVIFPTTGQPAQNLSIMLLQNSGDSGNSSGFFPSTFPVTYGNYEAVRFVPQQFAGGVPTANPAMLTNTIMWMGVGVGFGRGPASMFEVTGQPSLATGVGFTAGGVQTAGIQLSNNNNFGIYFGSGAPTFVAALGSLYLRSDGTTTNNRAYINNSAGAVWTPIITAA